MPEKFIFLKPAQASPVNSTELSYGASGHGSARGRRASRGTSEPATLGRAKRVEEKEIFLADL